MKTRQKTKPLPNPHDCINLSLPYDSVISSSSKASAPAEPNCRIGVRNAIRNYRENVRRTLSFRGDKSKGHATNYGVWRRGVHKGTFVMNSTLNSQSFDQSIDGQLHLPCGDPANIHYSLEMRRHVRVSAHSNLDAMIFRISDGQSFNCYIQDYSKKNANIRHKAILTKYGSSIWREFAIHMHCPEQPPNLLLKCVSPELTDGFGGPRYQVNAKTLGFTKFPVIKYPEGAQQHIFIDLRTLAILSSNVVGCKKVLCEWEVWMWWAIMATASGLPIAILTPSANEVKSGRSISPARTLFDPIYCILTGMWALEFADDFAISLCLDHPNSSKRGVYMRFNLEGDQESSER